MKGVFITATDTDAGKTWVGARLLSELNKRNINPQARKPVESGWPESADLSATDAWKLANAIDQVENLEAICPHRFAAALSPDRAAMLENTTLTLQQLHDSCMKNVSTNDFLYVEGAGGFYSPICKDALNADLAKALELPVVLIVENRLGCINQALLNVAAIKNKGLKLVAIVLNKNNDIQTHPAMDNLTDIKNRVDCEVIEIKFNEYSSKPIERLAERIIQTQD